MVSSLHICQFRAGADVSIHRPVCHVCLLSPRWKQSKDAEQSEGDSISLNTPQNAGFVWTFVFACCWSGTLGFCVPAPHVSESFYFIVISSLEPRLPAAQAVAFLLQTPHVISHVKWQKAQHCQVCEGDLMELKMGCFVVIQSILLHRCILACSHCALKQKILHLLPGVKSEGCVYSWAMKQATESFGLFFPWMRAFGFGPLRQLCTRALFSSTPELFWAGLYTGLSTVQWRAGVQIVFIFHF